MVFEDRTKRIYSEEEAATILGMTKRMLAMRRRAGKIGHVKDGRYIGYTQEHLDRYCRKIDSAYEPEFTPPKTPSAKKRSKWHDLPWAERKKTFRKISPDQKARIERSSSRIRPETKTAFAEMILHPRVSRSGDGNEGEPTACDDGEGTDRRDGTTTPTAETQSSGRSDT